MAVTRLFDLFNCLVGATQLVGPTRLQVTHGRRTQQSNTDGVAGVAARDRTVFYAEGQLETDDWTTFATILSQFEANDSQAVQGEGKEAGSASQAWRVQMLRQKLLRASLQLTNGGYSRASYGTKNSAAAASNTIDDEVAITTLSKSVTVAAAKRAARLAASATFTPDGGGGITVEGIEGVSIDVAGESESTFGNGEFGEITEVGGYVVTGTLTLKNVALTSLLSHGQNLLEQTYGVLALPVTMQAGTAGTTLTLKNLAFEEDATSAIARKLGMTQLRFGCFGVVGTTIYGLATGTNKIITIA